jgi:hypothetical protein
MMDEMKIVNTSKLYVLFNSSKIASLCQTLSGSAGNCPALPKPTLEFKKAAQKPSTEHCPILPDIIRPSWTLSRF